MIDLLLARMRQGHRTIAFPEAPPALPGSFRGLPILESGRCEAGCQECQLACPTGAVGPGPDGTLDLDLGRCLFCGDCQAACPTGAVALSGDYRLATRTRDALAVSEFELAGALDERMRRLLGRSLRLRQVSAGGCNACEAEVNALSNVVFDMSRFGIQMVASPRHADGLLITGPVTQAMRLALQKAYEAVPDPKIVVAVGACAISGGLFADHEEICGGAASVVPVDLFIPGCPPHPVTLLDGLLRLMGRLLAPEGAAARSAGR